MYNIIRSMLEQGNLHDEIPQAVGSIAKNRHEHMVGTVDGLPENWRELPLFKELQELDQEGLRDPERRLRIIEGSGVGDFIVSMWAIHQLVAPEFDSNPTESSMMVQSRIPIRMAPPNERYDVLKYTHEKALAVIDKYRQEGGELSNALERVANLAAFGGLFAHPYEGGNGRTARTQAHIIRFGFDQGKLDGIDGVATLHKLSLDGGGQDGPDGRYGSYKPLSIDANRNPTRYLDHVAALGVPLESTLYRDGANFITPYDPPDTIYRTPSGDVTVSIPVIRDWPDQ